MTQAKRHAEYDFLKPLLRQAIGRNVGRISRHPRVREEIGELRHSRFGQRVRAIYTGGGYETEIVTQAVVNALPELTQRDLAWMGVPRGLAERVLRVRDEPPFKPTLRQEQAILAADQVDEVKAPTPEDRKRSFQDDMEALRRFFAEFDSTDVQVFAATHPDLQALASQLDLRSMAAKGLAGAIVHIAEHKQRQEALARELEIRSDELHFYREQLKNQKLQMWVTIGAAIIAVLGAVAAGLLNAGWLEHLRPAQLPTVAPADPVEEPSEP